MAVSLSPDARKQALASIKRFCAEHLDREPDEIGAALMLDFFLKELAPSAYNAGVADAQTFLRDRLADLEGNCYEPEFVYWPKGSSVRRK